MHNTQQFRLILTAILTLLTTALGFADDPVQERRRGRDLPSQVQERHRGSDRPSQVQQRRRGGDRRPDLQLHRNEALHARGSAVDLEITGIYSSACHCPDELERTGVIFMKDILVRIRNRHSEDSGRVTVSGEIEVTYYDESPANRLIRQVKSFNLRSGSARAITAVDGYVLARKARGIKAEVRITGRNQYDHTTDNNVVTVRDCRSGAVMR